LKNEIRDEGKPKMANELVILKKQYTLDKKAWDKEQIVMKEEKTERDKKLNIWKNHSWIIRRMQKRRSQS